MHLHDRGPAEFHTSGNTLGATWLLLLLLICPAPLLAGGEPNPIGDIVDKLIHFGAWDGKRPITLPLRLIHSDDRTPATDAAVAIRTGEGGTLYRADEEGRVAIPLEGRPLESRFVTPEDEWISFWVTAHNFDVRRLGGDRPPFVFRSTIDLPVLRAGSLRIYHEEGLEKEALQAAVAVSKSLTAAAEALGEKILPFRLLVTDEPEGAGVFTDGGVFPLTRGEISREGVDLRVYIHETVEHHLIHRLGLYHDAKNRWVGDGIAEWTAYVTVRETRGREAALAILDRARGKIRRAMQQDTPTYDFFADFEALSGPRADEFEGEGVEAMALGYPMSLALWLDLSAAEGKPVVPDLLEFLRSNDERSHRELIRWIEKRTETDLLPLLRRFSLEHAHDALEAEMERLEADAAASSRSP